MIAFNLMVTQMQTQRMAGRMLRLIYTDQKRKRKQKLSLIFVAYSLIFIDSSLIFVLCVNRLLNLKVDGNKNATCKEALSTAERCE